MPKENIRERILKFIKSEIRVIVSTTIIESGIDIPDVDTIIIDEADKFGLSSLYQLKGRVGRRDKEAYAYLLYRIENSASIGMKRLQIIEDYAELGSGYKVALKDLEIRGYGEILGKEQSGYISRVGFNMYKILLENVINEIENKEKEKYNKCEIEIETNGFIPENYINCKDLRFNIYQKLYLIDYMDELINYKNEIENNFGKIPEELNKLFEINFLRIKSQYKKIDKIWENRDDIIIIFNNETKLKIENLIEKVKKNEIFIDKKNKNMIKIKNSFISFEEKINFLNSIIDNIFEK
jgi:transcription-repair coupling factor (superfamily II helicase)